MARVTALAALAVFVGTLGATVALAHDTAKPRRTVGHGQVRFCVRGLCGGPELWAHRDSVHDRKWRDERALRRRLEARVELLARKLRAARVVQARRLQAHETTTVWDRLIGCEAAGYGWPLLTTGNGFYFAPQFTAGTWNANRGALPTVDWYMAAGHPPAREDQIVVAERVLATQGWQAWPTCSRLLGLR